MSSIRLCLISEELEAQLSLKRWEVYPTIGQEIRLDDISRREPPQRMFNMPEGVAVVHK
jgi:hypothetical protein